MSLDVLPLSTADYIADTQHLTTVQHGAYMLILMAMWRAGGWINDDDRQLATICRFDHACRWQKIAAPVRALLTARDGKLTQKRLLAEHEAQTQKLFRLKQNGCLGGKAKALKNQESRLANATLLPETDEKPTYVEEEVIKKEESIGRQKSKTTPHRLPEDWSPGEEGFGYAARNGFSRPRAEEIFVAFRTHHVGKATRWARWDLAWQQWVRNEVRWSTDRRGNGKAGSTVEAGRNLLARLEGLRGAPRGANGAGDAADHVDVRLLPER